ncbi:MAG TPA: TRAP transporter small permease [Burkholderiaceae bacterium]|jgi:TRAP-type C4-dicarboxylate transport system permease small subunit|nr:TRAP transporter small permease [Burkholderiaceae bacterium]
MHYFDRWVTRISTAMAVVAAVLLLAATLIITMMVIKRGIGLQNSWELELSIELMVGAIFLASPYTLATGGHVKMDLLDALLPASLKHYLAFVAGLIGCLVCLYLGWTGLQMTQHAFVTGERALGIWQPLAWPKYATIPTGMLMTALQYVVSMHREYCARRENVHQEASTCQN